LGGNSNVATINSYGTYTVTVTDPSTGCTNTSTSIVNAPPPANAGISPDITIALGSSTTLTASGGTVYNWIPSTALNSSTGNSVIASPVQTTTYCVEVIDNNGCKDTAGVTCSVEIPCSSDQNFKIITNAFSPNGDNVNEEYCLQGWEICLKEFQVLIYNRWGEKVFESKDPNFCWDGYFKNSKLEAQVFVYYIRAEYTDRKDPIIKEGNISLLR